jgi:hypothetical protein
MTLHKDRENNSPDLTVVIVNIHVAETRAFTTTEPPLARRVNSTTGIVAVADEGDNTVAAQRFAGSGAQIW